MNVQKRTKMVLVLLGAAVLIGGGGYLLYRTLIADSEAGLQRQRERILPPGGPAVHPSEKK